VVSVEYDFFLIGVFQRFAALDIYVRGRIG